MKQDLFITFAEPRSDDVLANRVSPQIITAIASRMIVRDEVDPVYGVSAGHSVPALANRLALELNPALYAPHLHSIFIHPTHFSLSNHRFPTV